MKNYLFDLATISCLDIIHPTPSSYARASLLYVQEMGYLDNCPMKHSEKKTLENTYGFCLVLDGEGELEYGENKYQLKAGDCALIDCSIPYSCYSKGKSDWSLRWIRFFGPHMEAFGMHYKQFAEHPVFSAKHPKTYIDLLLSLWNQGIPGEGISEEFKMSGLVSLLISAALQECSR